MTNLRLLLQTALPSFIRGHWRFTERRACIVAMSAVAIAHAMLVTPPSVRAEDATPTRASLQWYRGNTHAHTLNSDGESTPEAVALWYREHKYQFIFITDHEYVSNVEPLNNLIGATERFLVLPGQEVTQWSLDPSRSAAFAGAVGAPAHVNALFTDEVIYPVGTRKCARCATSSPADTPIGATFKINIEAILSRGGIAQVNHPNLLWALRPEDLSDVPDRTLLEIWNGAVGPAASSLAPPNNLGGDDGSGDIRPSAEGFWDWLLSRGKIIWAVGSDDSHTLKGSDTHSPQGGHAWIVIRAPSLTSENIKAALLNGEFYGSTGVALEDISSDHRSLSLSIDPPRNDAFPGFVQRYSTRFIGRGGKLLATVAGLKPSYRFSGSETYIRAVISDSSGRQAWTQPVFLDGRDGRELTSHTRR